MPDMIPVGNTIKPYDPNTGISSISGMLGIQQQRQNLQTGQYLQQTAQAGAIEAQQGAKELQAGSRLLADPVGNGLVDEDGNPTKNAYSIIKSVMPTTGDERYQSLIKTAQGHVEFRNAAQNLSQNEQGYVSSRLAGIAADPNAHISDVANGVAALKAQFAGTAEEDSVNRMTKVMQDAIDDAGDKHGMDGVRKVITGFSRGAIGNTGISGSGGLTAPQITTMQAPGGLQAVNTNPLAQGGVGPVGSPMKQGVTPSVVSTPAGPLAKVGSSGTTLTPLVTSPGNGPGSPPGPNLNPTAVQQATNLATAQGVAGRVQQAQAAANNTIQAQDALSRARTILDNPNAPNTGGLFETKKAIKNLLAGAGIDTQGADDTNTLVKNLARYEAARATQAGLGGTDAARELAHSGSPNVSLDNEALKGIVTQSLATEKALAAYANVQGRTQDPATLLKNESAFRSIPHLIEGYEYGLARNPQEADGFLQKHGLSRSQMKAIRDRIKTFEGQ